MADTATVSGRTAWRAWLLAQEPGSRLQARLGRFYVSWKTFLGNPLAVVGLVIVLALILCAIFADVLATHSPYSGGDLRTDRLLPPGHKFWLGSDDQARDIYSRIVYGSRL